MDGNNTQKKSIWETVKKVLLILLAAALVAFIVWTIVSGIARKNEEDEEKIPDREYVESEVLEAAKSLLSSSTLLNDIYFGKGIPTDEEKGTPDAAKGYLYADTSYLESVGIDTVEKLKEVTRGVFSDEVSERIFSDFLHGKTVGGVVVGARYIPYKVETGNAGEYEILGILVKKDVSTNKLIRADERCEFDLESIKVIRSEGNRVKLEVSCTVTKGDVSQTRVQTVYLIEEDDGWRLDSYSKIAYIPENT